MDGHAYFDDPHQAELAEILHFTPKDLECNRQRALSKTQAEQLANELRKQLIVLTVILIVSVVMGGIALLDILEQPLLVWAALIIVALWTLATRFGNLNRLKNGLDVQRSVLKMPDNMMFYIGTTMRTPEGDKLHFPHRLYRTVYAKQPYALYYLPMPIARHGFHILSLEPIDERVYPEEKVKVKQKPKAKRQRNTL